MKHPIIKKALLASFMTTIMLFTFACEDESISPENGNCAIEATVKDFTGLGGCGWMLELEGGERLHPVSYQGQAFTAENLEEALAAGLSDGMKVKINYAPAVSVATTCMAGTTVDITCISAVEGSD